MTPFVSHHLHTFGGEYWKKQLGTASPDPKNILNILQLWSHWGDENILHFILPEEVTDHDVSIRFDVAGDIEEITMKS